MKHITLKELAAHLYLSPSTVSRALRDAKDVNKSTKEKVRFAAEQLGYFFNTPKLDVKSKTKTIGFIVSKTTTLFFAKVLDGVRKILYPLGYKLIILESDNNLERERENLLQLEAFNVDGIIINIYSDYNLYTCKGIITRGTPVVLFGKKRSNGSESTITIANDHITACDAFEDLINRENNRVACLMGSKAERKICEQARDYDRILNKFKIQDSSLIIETDDLQTQGGELAVKKLLEANIKFDSIFALSFWMAYGALSYLKKENIKLLEKITIVDYSGRKLTSTYSIVDPPEIVLDQPPLKIGETAAELIIDKIEENLVNHSNTISFYPGFIDMTPPEHPMVLCAGREYLYFSENSKKKKPKKEKILTSYIFE
ncbi:LacI family DNA-binding transcriptional regulator [Flavobacterium piscisymbiosum]|uniref:LacI family transcriptional regulator n=1 Tax=Flavobacterium piscisymbiosum TaxID=2893753 RepID=A0ABS8MJT1_9FLAO|nr:LacI family DNA-binding transcriptional regulator [Flavobacterium sp. F-30]MCC9065759.1 LacI family transcriptional regulator [Flavobacterium sp. F-30]